MYHDLEIAYEKYNILLHILQIFLVRFLAFYGYRRC